MVMQRMKQQQEDDEEPAEGDASGRDSSKSQEILEHDAFWRVARSRPGSVEDRRQPWQTNGIDQPGVCQEWQQAGGREYQLCLRESYPPNIS